MDDLELDENAEDSSASINANNTAADTQAKVPAPITPILSPPLTKPAVDPGTFKPSSCLSPSIPAGSSQINFTFRNIPKDIKSCMDGQSLHGFFKLIFPDQESHDSGFSFPNEPISDNKSDETYSVATVLNDPSHFGIISQLDGVDDIQNILTSGLNTLNVKNRIADFELNKPKQMNAIRKDAFAKDIHIIRKDEDKSININCSSGFYDQVAKPTLCGLVEGHIPTVLGVPILCDSITRNFDSVGREYNRTLFFKLGHPGPSFIGSVTIHSHNSTRNVQVQGGATMSDKTRVGVWFVNNVLTGRFHTLAKTKNYKIKNFNQAIIQVTDRQMNAGVQDTCGLCTAAFDSRAKPSYCLRCVKWFHKSRCYKDHKCQKHFENSDHGPSSSSSYFLSSGSPTFSTSLPCSSSGLFVPNPTVPAPPMSSISPVRSITLASESPSSSNFITPYPAVSPLIEPITYIAANTNCLPSHTPSTATAISYSNSSTITKAPPFPPSSLDPSFSPVPLTKEKETEFFPTEHDS